jgi:hypothetical protein
MKRLEQTNPSFLPPFTPPKNTLNRLPVIQDWLLHNHNINTLKQRGEDFWWLVSADTCEPIYSVNKKTKQEKIYVDLEGVDSCLAGYNLRKVKPSWGGNPAVYNVGKSTHPCDTYDSVILYGSLMAVQQYPSNDWLFFCGVDNGKPQHRKAGEKETEHFNNLKLIVNSSA